MILHSISSVFLGVTILDYQTRTALTMINPLAGQLICTSPLVPYRAQQRHQHEGCTTQHLRGGLKVGARCGGGGIPFFPNGSDLFKPWAPWAHGDISGSQDRLNGPCSRHSASQDSSLIPHKSRFYEAPSMFDHQKPEKKKKKKKKTRRLAPENLPAARPWGSFETEFHNDKPGGVEGFCKLWGHEYYSLDI